MMSSGRSAQQRALGIALAVNALFMGVEFAAGIAFGSLALLADSAHMLSDVVALSVALIALRLAQRPHSTRHTYGLQRAEVIGAQVNGVALFAVAAWILYEAVRRLDNPVDVDGGPLMIVACLGLAVNVGSAIALSRSAGASLNVRGALLHMTLDAAGSVGAILAGLAIVGWRARWADPAVSMVIAVLVLWSAYKLVRETVHVLLEGAPRHIDVLEAERLLADDPAVEGVHHVHVWSLASDVPALSAHVVLSGEVSLHEAQLHGDRLKGVLAERLGIHHTTLELECHDCE